MRSHKNFHLDSKIALSILRIFLDTFSRKNYVLGISENLLMFFNFESTL